MTDGLHECEDRLLCARIVAEYLEMPGLNVTIAQACRLWSVERQRCERLLDVLLDSGFLRRSGETYVLADVARRAA